MRRLKKYCLVAVAVTLTGCQTYYEKTLVFNSKYEQGNYEEARKYLTSQKKLQKDKDKVLYNLNYATASFMMDDTEESIKYFLEADDYISQYSKNVAYEALTLVSNPTVKPYQPEYYEAVMLHFYQALNYTKMNDYENAMVECRRMNLELQKLNDAFKKHDGTRYSRDAFGHHFMGMLYETMGDYNNAFIAYRNALEIYEEDYLPMYGTAVPEILKTQIVRAAYLTGFRSQGQSYEKKFNIKYQAPDRGKGKVIVFVLDGMSPVKTETTLDFVKTNGVGVANFYNAEMNITVPIFYGGLSGNERTTLNDFSYFKMTLPKYVSRKSKCSVTTLTIGGKKYKTELLEDVDKIAKQSLKDRFWAELGKAILRMATKEATHKAASKQNEYVGLLVNIANVATEKADTRCWMSLPASVKMIETQLDAGEYEVSFSACGVSENVAFDVVAGRTCFVCLRGM